MSNASALIRCFRLDTAAIELLGQLAADFGLTEAITVEKLILDQAKAAGLVVGDSPSLALIALLEEVGQILDKHGGLRSDPDVMLRIYDRIRATPRLARLHAAALVPPSTDLPAEKRQQFVHQRIGRFVKDYLGLAPAEGAKSPLEKGTPRRSYTRLRPR